MVKIIMLAVSGCEVGDGISGVCPRRSVEVKLGKGGSMPPTPTKKPFGSEERRVKSEELK